MPRLSENQEPEGEEFSLLTACQHCDRLSVRAVYIKSKSTLLWYCEEGHESKMENFNIG